VATFVIYNTEIIMTLVNQINEDIKLAMKAKAQAELRALRALKAAFLMAQTEKNAKELDETRCIQIVQKLLKQREDSLHIYKEKDRSDLAIKEEEEIAILKKYLPVQMNEAEIKSYLENLIKKTGASGMQDMGRIMGMASKELAGKADNKIVATFVRLLLNN